MHGFLSVISLVVIGDTEVEYMFVKFVRFTLGGGGGVNIYSMLVTSIEKVLWYYLLHFGGWTRT